MVRFSFVPVIGRVFGLGAFVVVMAFSSSRMVLAHGGEDHGDAGKPAVTEGTNEVARLATVHDIEILLKHPLPTPDVPLQAKVFLTKVETNEPVAETIIEITLRGVGVDQVTRAVPSDVAGSYVADLTALPEGSYDLSAVLDVGGESQEVVFGKYEVLPTPAAVQTAPKSPVLGILGAIGLSLGTLGSYMGAIATFRRLSRRSRREVVRA